MEMFQAIHHEMVMTNRLFEAELNDILRQQGIHRSDWSVLFYLQLNQNYTSVEIAKMLGIEKPNVTRTIKHLESIGYVTVKPSKEDKRKKRLFVTEAGNKMYREVQVHIDQLKNATLENIPLEQQQIFFETLQKIQHNLQQKAGNTF